ncbi:hypothetical protein [Sinomicrobium sp. M5D2P9]
MNEIKILFFALGSFFGVEDGRIVADKTTVHIHPQEQEIEIIQEDLFAFIQSENDEKLVLEQWDKIYNWKEKNTAWAKELDNFIFKDFKLSPVKMTTQTYLILIRPHLTLKYTQEKDLASMGIWFNADKNKFYLNNIPDYNIQSDYGKIEGNYWVFSANDRITFTIEPYLKKTDKFNNSRIPLKKLLRQSKG